MKKKIELENFIKSIMDSRHCRNSKWWSFQELLDYLGIFQLKNLKKISKVLEISIKIQDFLGIFRNF
jgi:hypothetical protein